ncbi:MAG: GTPase [Fimbriimonadaceae bacterium]|jgi:GTP-binding protein|nr:GTPase [Fimbriimonadaceae bacterium]
MVFLDEAVVEFVSGRGGSGAVSFHTEKFVPRGGPDGANGGKGGNITLIADRSKRTLYDFKLKDKFEAKDGEHGVSNKRGRDGKGIEVKVPVGTVVADEATGEPIVDLNHHGMKFVIAKGGRGGFGNEHFVNSVRQAPNFAEKGEPGERRKVTLELKLLADVALVGLPNAGKSTLISRISSAKPKIADYPFTTIVPNLGVVHFRDTSFVVADMPGLIEGAHQGVGLGDRFLRHVERSRVLVHVVDALPIDESDPIANYELIENELKLYSEEIWRRPRVIALNKIDLTPSGEFNDLRKRFEVLGHPLFPISAVTGQGLDPLLHAMADAIENMPEPEELTITPTLKPAADNHWEVMKTDQGFKVEGKGVERMVAMTNLESRDALRHLHRRLERMGVIDKLREMGVEEGESVEIGEIEFAYSDQL